MSETGHPEAIDEPARLTRHSPVGALPKASPLRRNQGGYFGERIEVNSVLDDCAACAVASDWHREQLTVRSGLDLLALHRPSNVSDPLRVYISAGIHGDEPAGPLAIKNLISTDVFPAMFEVWVCPCLNPTGFQQNCRENCEGKDLNRQYLQPAAREIIAHVSWLQQQPSFDLCLCLHEDWESLGFYLYELNPDNRPSMAQRVIDDVSHVCPIDYSDVIDGRPASGGVISPAFAPNLRPDWPEAFFLLMHKTRLCYTLEAPSDYPLMVRVAALEAAVKSALLALQEQQMNS